MTKKLLNPTYGFDFNKYHLKQFGRLTVIGHIYDHSLSRPKRRLICKCKCGNEITLNVQNVSRGLTKSCGCLRQETLRETAKKNKKHGHANSVNGKENTPIYKSLKKIKECCYAGWRKGFHKVCHEYDPRWEDFNEFLKDFGEIEDGLTISRHDNQMPWSKENCYINQGRT
jgi:hypothetical protein